MKQISERILEKIFTGSIFAAVIVLLLGGFMNAHAETAAQNKKAVPAAVEAAAEKETAGRFSYEHDPRLNERAMEDIIENPDAVYGFSPDPDSKRLGQYADFDWTDEEAVAEAKQSRVEYHESMETMMDILYKMRDEGKSIEEMARAVSEERNRLRLASYENDPVGLEKVKASNLETYGNENGPTADSLFEKYGSWEIVLQKAFSPNMGMDACCGLYDEYYDLYIELGLVETEK